MRESYNIFWFIKQKMWSRVFFLTRTLITVGSQGKDTRTDTWNGFKEITWCKIFGHKPDYSKIGNLDCEQDIWCKCCSKYLKTLSYEEHKQKIRELKLERIIQD